ncbi:GTPase [Arcanobacterium phocae]|uniref:GTPase n=1 Tax=Arcanobacterium phocae TaxID=131112 RepID=UPI001C0F10BD|nr:GTPase [Arcanobacterium phocae]
MSLSVKSGVELLADIVDTVDPYLSPDTSALAHENLVRINERRNLSSEVTVIAFAGPTGAGKSSIVNALINEKLLPVAATRPTTSQATAISAMSEHSDDGLIQWVGATNRYERPQLHDVFSANAPFVLVDLPDIDSTSAENRTLATSIIKRADVVVWVVDPQKYADSVVHDDYLAQRSEHSGTMLVVLNQADKLVASEKSEILSSLKQILDAHNVVPDVTVASAQTGIGIAELRDKLSQLVMSKKTFIDKLAADLRVTGQSITQDFESQGGQLDDVPQPDTTPFVDAALRAAGAPVVARLAGESYTFRAKKATRWPVTRWISMLNMDPLQRFRLGSGKDAQNLAPVTGISRSDVALQQADNEYHRYLAAATAHMPRRWANDIMTSSVNPVTDIVRRADYVSSHTELENNRRPAWWRIVNIIQWLLMIGVLTGVVWLIARAIAVNMGIWLDRPPMIGILPLPLVMVVSGIALGWVLSLMSKVFIRRGQAKTERRIQSRLSAAFQQDLTEGLLEPLAQDIEQYRKVVHDCKELMTVKS